jgi:hypothetical protein
MPSELTSSIGPLRADRRRRLCLRSDRGGGRRTARRLSVRLQRTEIEGPRLGDLDLSSSTYGGVIPVCFGVQKVAGTMSWATDIDEDKNTEKVGEGVFGGGQKIVEYRYFANSAVAFGEGPAGGVLRIWAGEKLIADLRTEPSTSGGGSFAEVVQALIAHAKYKFRIYLGTEDQQPDPLIRRWVEPDHGEHAVPAHRGLVYIVFEDFPLDEFGNRIPPITAEISWAGAAEAVLTDTTFLSATGYSTGALAIDPVRGEFYVLTSGALSRVRISSMTEELRVTQSELGTESLDPHVVDPDGNIYGTIGISATSFVKIDADTMQVVATRGFGSNVQLEIASAYTLTGRIDFVLGLSFLGATARVFYADTLLQFWEGQDVSTRPRGVVAGLSDFGTCEGWFAAAPSIVLGAATTTVNILHVRMELPFEVSVVDATPAVVKPKLITLAAADFGASNMTITNLCYDELNDRIVWFGDLEA